MRLFLRLIAALLALGLAAVALGLWWQTQPLSLRLAAGTTMTVDAALVTLDFALRRGLLAAPQRQPFEARWRALCITAPIPAAVQSP